MNNPGIWLLLSALLSGCATGYPPPPRERPPVRDGAAGPPTGTPETVTPAAREPAAPAPAVPNNAEAPTVALLRQSERSADGGDLAGAIAYVERAIRLNSRDAELWLRLAGLQLRAGEPATAEQLAQKAIALAGDRDDHRRRGWLLVADAREAQGDEAGARSIRERWRTFRG